MRNVTAVSLAGVGCRGVWSDMLETPWEQRVPADVAKLLRIAGWDRRAGWARAKGVEGGAKLCTLQS